MPANIQVVLQHDIDKLGKAGALVRVRPGFARNFLLPRQLAVAATTAAVHRIEHDKAVALARAERARKEATEAAGKLSALTVKLTLKAGDDGKLFGSVTAKDIEKAAKALGVDIDKKQLKLDEPIKNVGTHTVTVRLAHEVTGTLKVEVVAK